jgi:hypothetical protein
MARHWASINKEKAGIDGRGTLINICREIGLIPFLVHTRIVMELQAVLVIRPYSCRHESGKTLNGPGDVVVFVWVVSSIHNMMPVDGQVTGR